MLAQTVLLQLPSSRPAAIAAASAAVCNWRCRNRTNPTSIARARAPRSKVRHNATNTSTCPLSSFKDLMIPPAQLRGSSYGVSPSDLWRCNRTAEADLRFKTSSKTLHPLCSHAGSPFTPTALPETPPLPTTSPCSQFLRPEHPESAFGAQHRHFPNRSPNATERRTLRRLYCCHFKTNGGFLAYQRNGNKVTFRTRSTYIAPSRSQTAASKVCLFS